MSRQAGKRPGEAALDRQDAKIRRHTRQAAEGKRVCRTCNATFEITETEDGWRLFACAKCGPQFAVREIDGHLVVRARPA